MRSRPSRRTWTPSRPTTQTSTSRSSATSPTTRSSRPSEPAGRTLRTSCRRSPPTTSGSSAPPTAFGDAFSIFLLRQFLLTIPSEYVDAAKVDGCSDFQAMLHVVIPMAKPAIAAVALFQFFYCWNDYFGPQIYASENPGAWTLELGLESFKSAHHTDWNLTMAATLMVMAPVIIVVLLRAEGLHRRRDPDRSQGMKLAVVGGGSTYTPELVDGIARLRDDLEVDELVLIDPAPERLELVGGVSPADLRELGHPARVTTTTDLDAGGRRRRRRAAAAARRRAGGPRRRRDLAARVRLRRAGDDRRRWPGQGAAHRPGRPGHRRAGATMRSPDAWIVDFTNPVGIVTRALLSGGPPGDRSVQRGHRVPAALRRAARRRARRRAARPRRPQPPDLGARRAASTASTCCRSCSPSTLAGCRRPRSSCRRGLLQRLGVGAVVLPELLLRPRRGRARAADAAVARRGGGGHREASCSTCTPTRRLETKPSCCSRAGGAYYSEAAVAARASLLAGDAGGETCTWSTSPTTAPCRSWPTTP